METMSGDRTALLPKQVSGQLSTIVVEAPRRDQNPALIYLASLAVGSRRTMGDGLGIIATLLVPKLQEKTTLERLEAIPWGELRFQHSMAVRAALSEKYSYATTNKMLSALRGTIKTAWRLGQMSAEEYQRAVDIPRVQGETLPAGRSLKIGEIAALIEVFQKDTKATGARDAAIVALLYGCGLRRAELATLKRSDYNAEEGTIRILGKRNKQRLVPVVGGAQAALSVWLEKRGESAGALFIPSRKGGKLVFAYGEDTELLGMTAQALYLILIERAKECGVSHFSPHDFRRTFVGDLLDRGADIATVQKMAGHANVTTTARYDRRGEVAKRKAAELLHVPFRQE
jgi:site-specific recombinase XerD